MDHQQPPTVGTPVGTPRSRRKNGGERTPMHAAAAAGGGPPAQPGLGITPEENDEEAVGLLGGDAFGDDDDSHRDIVTKSSDLDDRMSRPRMVRPKNNGVPHRRGSTSYAGEYEHRQQSRKRRRCFVAVATLVGATLWYAQQQRHGNSSSDGGGVGGTFASTGRSPLFGGFSHWFTRSGGGSATSRTHRTYRSGRANPRAFVCITGQLPRLELANKIQNLFQYWGTTHNAQFDVALVLTDTAHQSVERQGHRDQQYYDIREVYEELSALPNVRVLNADLDTQAESPILNPHYMRQRGHDSTMNSTQLLTRVQNHVRQFESLARCHHHMSAAGLGWEHYDIVHRVRDDSGYFTTVDFDHLYELTTDHPMTIVSSDCEYHGGINDRGSFVSPEAAYDYFNHPILAMYVKPLPVDVRNTEQFLMVTYGRTCRLVQTDSFHLFRLWDKNSTVSFSDSDIKCIVRNQIGQGNEKAIHKRKKICHLMDDGNEYCVYLDKAGLTYFPEHVEVVELNVANARNDDDDLVWDRHTAKQVAVAGGFVAVDDFDDDDDVEPPRYRADRDYTEDSSDVEGLPDEGPDHDPSAEVELDGADDDVYITLDSGDDHDKISGKKLERKKARAEKRNKNKGLLAGAAGDDEEEKLPEEMQFPGAERLLRYLGLR